MSVGRDGKAGSSGGSDVGLKATGIGFIKLSVWTFVGLASPSAFYRTSCMAFLSCRTFFQALSVLCLASAHGALLLMMAAFTNSSYLLAGLL